ncbi:putative integral membrane protein conserved region-domain-containing protein [Cunninghamella echinulata]|nr:putative integral membrane protein conserved region-domain-containing protein [Cunninghamella echinulata]
MGWIVGLFFYLLGGFTFIPLILWITQKYLSISQVSLPIVSTAAQEVDVTTPYNYGSKKGWVRLSSNYQPKSTDIGKKKNRAKQNGEGYGVYKQGILKVYTNELQQHCEWTIDVNDYDISIYPPGRKEHTLFSRSVAILLERKQQSTLDKSTQPPHSIQDKVIYFSCPRPIDKEDWYFAFISSSSSTSFSSPTYRRAIPFDPMAMASLVTTIGKQQYEDDESALQQQIPWFNAILGRTFLATYKTRRFQDYVLDTLAKKTKKMKTPGFLGDIQVKSVDLGHSMPFITQPRIVSINPDGTLIIDAQLDYKGGFNVAVEASAGGGPFSIRVPLILSLTLKSLSGTIRFKVKPPPSNRYWVGFCTMPTMKWSIVPAVSNYNVKISMVTNIIESKIKKLMTDNVVLPNMSDIPFSKSNGLGGLFAETQDILLQQEEEKQQKLNVKKINEEMMDSTKQQSFVINNSDSKDNVTPSESIKSISQSTSSTTSGSSSSKWSRLFGSRRRKNANQSTKMGYNMDGDMTLPNSNSSDSDGKDMNMSKSASVPIMTKNIMEEKNDHNKTDNIIDDTAIQDLHENIIKDDMKHSTISKSISIESDINDNGDGLENMDENNKNQLTSQTSHSATSLTGHRSNSTSTVSTTETTQSLDVDVSRDIRKEDDNISINSTTSTRRKRFYNAAGYLFSKGKGLANELKENKQKENQLKRQQSLLQYSGQLQDIRRRSKENIQRRSSVSSVSSIPLISTNNTNTTASDILPTNNTTDSSFSSLSTSLPPFHLIYDDITSSTPSSSTTTSTALNKQNNEIPNSNIEPIEEKPELPLRPSLPPRPQHKNEHSNNNNNNNNNKNSSLPPPLPIRNVENNQHHQTIVDSTLLYEQLPI